MKIYKCDRCGKKEPEKSNKGRPEEWVALGYVVSEYQRNYVYKDICPECVITLKLPKPINCPVVGERIIEIIEEIAQGVIEDQ